MGRRDPTLPVKPGKIRPFARFNVTQFAKLFEAMGLRFRWSRAMLCSCRINEQTGQPDPTCATCGGFGMRYVSPRIYDRPEEDLDYVVVKAFLSSASLDTDIFGEAGEMAHGSAQMSVPGEMDVGWRDRFVAIDHEMPFSEVLVRDTALLAVPYGHIGRTTTDRLSAMRYPPVKINFVGDESTTWFPVTDWRYREPVLGEVQQLEWLLGRGPADGARYSVHYTVRPVWVVDAAMYGVMDASGPEAGLTGSSVHQSLPRTFRVRLDWLTEQAPDA